MHACPKLCYFDTYNYRQLVTKSIPTYFENTESPISSMICYKYNKPIRYTILDLNKLVSDLDIETGSPDF